MTVTSPHLSLKVSYDRPLYPVTLALLRHVRDAARQMGTEFVVAGATARDIVLWHVYGIRAERATRDVDIAVCAVSWKAHGELMGDSRRRDCLSSMPESSIRLLSRTPRSANLRRSISFRLAPLNLRRG